MCAIAASNEPQQYSTLFCGVSIKTYRRDLVTLICMAMADNNKRALSPTDSPINNDEPQAKKAKVSSKHRTPLARGARNSRGSDTVVTTKAKARSKSKTKTKTPAARSKGKTKTKTPAARSKSKTKTGKKNNAGNQSDKNKRLQSAVAEGTDDRRFPQSMICEFAHFFRVHHTSHFRYSILCFE